MYNDISSAIYVCAHFARNYDSKDFLFHFGTVIWGQIYQRGEFDHYIMSCVFSCLVDNFPLQISRLILLVFSIS